MGLKFIIEKSGLTQRSWLNPFVIALLPALVIIFINPINVSKYNYFKERPILNTNSKKASAYVDFEGDGKKENIGLHVNTAGNGAFFLEDEDQNLLGQTNLFKPLSPVMYREQPKMHDFNGDGFAELCLITEDNSALFLNIFDYKLQKFIRQDVFIDSIGINEKHTDYYIFWTQVDGVKSGDENSLYFSVSSGFALYPRRLYKYKFKEDVLQRAENTGAATFRSTCTNSSVTSIIAFSNASGNCRPQYQANYHDTCCWIIGYDENLQQTNLPISMGKYPSGINSICKTDDGFIGLCGSRSALAESNFLFRLNEKGELVDSVKVDFGVTEINQLIVNNRTKFLLFYNNKTEFFTVDPYSLKVSKDKFSKKFEFSIRPSQNFINNNNFLDTYTTSSDSKNLVLWLDNLNNPIYLPLNSNEVGVRYVSGTTRNGKLFIDVLGVVNSYSYIIYPNPYYWFRIPFYVLIYLVTVLFMAAILFFQNKRFQQKIDIEHKIADLQLQNLRNQLDPHFTFNALNSVGNAIYQQNRDEAYDLFQRFTRMIRSSLMVSDKVFRSLEEELTFTKDYLEFQRTRFKERFVYQFEVDETLDLNQIQIPKMLLQNFAENAVKHAFYGVDYRGEIQIRVETKSEKVLIFIEDNGIGINRSKHEGKTSGTQKGELILRKQLEQINKLYKKDIDLQIVDRNREGAHHLGTIVCITI